VADAIQAYPSDERNLLKEMCAPLDLPEMGMRSAAPQPFDMARRRPRAPLEELAREMPGMLFQTRGTPEGTPICVPFISSRCWEYLGRTPEEIMDQPQLWLEAIHPGDRAMYYSETLRASNELTPITIEVRVISTTGQVRWLGMQSVPIRLECGDLLFNGVALDVTQRKQREAELRRARDELDWRMQQRTDQLSSSEQRFRQLAENIEETFWIATPDKSETIYISPGYERIFGRSCQSLYDNPKSFLEAVHPEDRRRVQESLPLQAKGQFEQEYRMIRPDGTVRWIWSRAFPIVNEKGEVYRIAGLAQDITKRKLAEEKLKREERLSRRLLDLQERERQLLAHDIHDGFVQDVTGAKMLLEGLRHRIENRGTYRPEELRVIEDLLSKAIREGRRLIGDLRPLIIDEEGVIEAINYLVAENCSKGSVAIAFEQKVKFQRLPPLLEGTIFRIVQEALTNIRRHSKATQAAIRLDERDGTLRIEVRDNGIGFDPAKLPEDRFGVRGIAERARLFGGTARIESIPGRGTRIYVKLPIGEATIG
jgi:PAS domain S-box-containing protein